MSSPCDPAVVSKPSELPLYEPLVQRVDSRELSTPIEANTDLFHTLPNIFASAHFFCHLDSSLPQSRVPLARCLLALFALVCTCWFHPLALGLAPATRLYLTSDYFTSPIECLPNIFFSCSTTCCEEGSSAPSAPDDLSYFGDDLSCVCSCLHSFFARRCYHLYSL